MEPVQNKTIYCDTHSQTLIDGLGKLWKENQFCDITLKVEGQEFNCHKNVLAANSEYFTSVFARDFKEKERNMIVLPTDFEIQPFQTLIEYFYSGRLILSPENAEGVLMLADYMTLTNVVEMTANFLGESLEKSNCIRRFSRMDSLQFRGPCVESVYKTAARLIVEAAIEESAIIDFLELSSELMPKIMTLNNEPDTSESLCLFLIKWITHDEDKRRSFLSDLLQLIPVAGITYEFFETHIQTEALLRRNPESLQWVVDNVLPQLVKKPPTLKDEASLKEPLPVVCIHFRVVLRILSWVLHLRAFSYQFQFRYPPRSYDFSLLKVELCFINTYIRCSQSHLETQGHKTDITIALYNWEFLFRLTCVYTEQNNC